MDDVMDCLDKNRDRLDKLHTLVCSLLCQGYMLRVEQDLKWEDYDGANESEVGRCYRHINNMKSCRVWIFPPDRDEFDEAIYSVLIGEYGVECWNTCWYGPTDEFCHNRLEDFRD
jgi:hypothetical protein